MAVCGLGRFASFFAAGGRAGARLPGLGGHGRLGIDARNRGDDFALGAIANNEYGAIFAAFQHTFQRVEAQAAFGALSAMATGAGRFKQRLDIGGESNALFGRGRRECSRPGRRLGSIGWGRRRFGGKDGAAGKEEPGGEQGSCELGFHVWGLMCRRVYRCAEATGSSGRL